MLDVYLRPHVDPVLNRLGKKILEYGVHANGATFVGFAFGITAMAFISQGFYLMGALFIALNRLMDGLDGAIARASKMTDFGGFLDISTDFIVYAGVVFAFAWAHPEDAFWPAFLIFSYMGPMVTFLAYAIIAEKKSVKTEARGRKSFYYLGGICEGTETAFVMILMCFIPSWLPYICMVFGALCWITTAGRIMSAWELSRA